MNNPGPARYSIRPGTTFQETKLQTSSDIPRVEAGPDTVHWGYFDANLKPVLTIASGDCVTMSSVSGTPQQLPPP